MNESCYICGNRDIVMKHKGVRDNKNIDVLSCNDCGLVFLSEDTHINVSFYEDSKMHNHTFSIEDWIRNTKEDDIRRYDYMKQKIKGKKVLDFGSGNGGFLNRINDSTDLAVGVELERAVISHYKKMEIPLYHNMEEVNDRFDYITLFHVLEHLKDPIKVLQRLEQSLKPDGEIIIEVPNANDALISLYDNKAFQDFTYWSCHLYLFNTHTFELLIRKAGLKLNFIQQVQRYSLSNHLYWLAEGKPGGQNIWNYLNDETLNELYGSKLAAIGKCDTLIASVSKEA